MKMLEEMMKMGKKRHMSDTEKSAKMDVLKEIADLASQAMADDVKGLKQVTVAAPDQEGLEEGLEKAQEIVEGEESEEGEDSSMAKLSPEEMEMFKKLQAKMKA